MEPAEKIKMLQVMYAGALADAVLRMGNEGVLEKVAEQKRSEQMTNGKGRATQLGIAKPKEVFTKLSALMGCADWTVSPGAGESGFTANASRCMLCAMAKKLGAQSPCRMYCLDPMEGMVKGLDGGASFEVQETLFMGRQCRVAVQSPQLEEGSKL